MNTKNVIISLPALDLEKAYRFYLEGIGLPLAQKTEDGSRPEPVLFVLNSGVKLMLIPADGFDWVTPGNRVAEPGVSECVITLDLPSAEAVDAFTAKAAAAGADILEKPGRRPWGYVGYFKDLDGHIWMAVHEGPGYERIEP